MRKWSLTLMLGSVLLSPAACGGDDDAPPAKHPQTPVVAGLASEVCKLAFRCCDRGEINFFFGPYVDELSCSDRFMAAAALQSELTISLGAFDGVSVKIPNLGALELAAAQHRGSVDPDAVKACIAHISSLECNKPVPEEEETCKRPQTPKTPAEDPCDPDKLFIGLVGEGGRCSSPLRSLECADWLVCRVSGPLGVDGVCALPSDIGEPCRTSEECAKDLYCSQLDGTCQLRRKEGETCVFSDRESPSPDPQTLVVACETGLSCDPVTDTCVAPCERGATCAKDDQCDETKELKCIMGRCDLLRGAGLPCAQDDDCVEMLHCGVNPLDLEERVCTPRLGVDELCAMHAECLSGYCDPVTTRCTATVPPGGLCPSGDDAQCEGGSCERDLTVVCDADTDCIGSGKCDLLTSRCAAYCVELRPDGAICTLGSECDSGACVAGFCRTLPLALGQACATDTQCESKFCSPGPTPVCKELPLPNGEACRDNTQCESGVCFASPGGLVRTCTEGLGEGAACGLSAQAPCNPKRFYCDQEKTLPVCVPLLETGEQCRSAAQCRGSCTIVFGRKMCAPVETKDIAVCDGKKGAP